MLNPREIDVLLRKHPFEPLEFTFSDGSKEIVRHPEMAIVTATSVAIGQFSDDEAIPDWLKTYALVHVLGVEPIQPQSAS